MSKSIDRPEELSPLITGGAGPNSPPIRDAALASLRTFVRESNRVEGILRPPLKRELRAHMALLMCPELTVMEVSRFVSSVQPGAELRIRPGMNVRVGRHVAPAGGSSIGYELFQLLDGANHGADPYDVHQHYEHLHPFMDGNGRSGRAVWMWQMVKQHRAGHVLHMGFLHLFYYQALAAWRGDGEGYGSPRPTPDADEIPGTTP